MKIALKVFSWIGIVIGALMLIASAGETIVSSAMSDLITGGYFIAWGVIGLIAIKKN